MRARYIDGPVCALRLPPQGPTLQRYRQIDSASLETPLYMKADVYLGLQSVVLAADSQDADALKLAQTELWFHLGPLQNDLLNMIVSTNNQ